MDGLVVQVGDDDAHGFGVCIREVVGGLVLVVEIEFVGGEEGGGVPEEGAVDGSVFAFGTDVDVDYFGAELSVRC